MNIIKQKEIANSFSETFQEFDINLTLKYEEFKLFENGVFARSMDEKWNIFILDNFMYWARSWSGNCIYKVQLTKWEDNITLGMGYVTRDRAQLNSENIEHDKIRFLELLQCYLDRDDIYIDPAYHFDIVIQTLAKYEPINRYIKSIGRQSVSINKSIYHSCIYFGQEYLNKSGWTEFYDKIKYMNDDEDILSLYIQEKGTNQGTTYHFDKEGKKIISIIVPVDPALLIIH